MLERKYWEKWERERERERESVERNEVYMQIDKKKVKPTYAVFDLIQHKTEWKNSVAFN